MGWKPIRLDGNRNEMKQILTYIKCDGLHGLHNDRPCPRSNGPNIIETVRDENYEYENDFFEYQGKDYCKRCYQDVILAEEGLRKCKYCNDGKKRRVKGMPAGWIPSYYDELDEEDWETYDCLYCNGMGTTPICRINKDVDINNNCPNTKW